MSFITSQSSLFRRHVVFYKTRDSSENYIKGLKWTKEHKFWETQPVKQFKDGWNTSLPEGPIENPIALSEVEQEPYNLPKDSEWITCDVDCEEMMTEVYNLLTHNYAERQ
ncbi:Myristoyl-CoA:protein N-myristoyltransferase [Parasponia andersonii]|uniref:glycylpeptide N-tetradecanoyltransferase n=1 Tax=Parasponia andersonii TaxID=3476 RepID=A0A2P5BEC5_PARAD|nr:Myristoyl-CoA:protein N-myristoyltransferase [Parasponia andersonii]